MNLSKFKNIFDYRHDFDESEINVMRNLWPNIHFYNIPLSWVYPIDEMLLQLHDINKIKEIRQDYGQFIIINDELDKKDRDVISAFKEMIYYMDADIHAELKAS